MLSRAARPAIALARTANQQQAGMATLKEIEQRCVGRFRPGDTERGEEDAVSRANEGVWWKWYTGTGADISQQVEVCQEH